MLTFCFRVSRATPHWMQPVSPDLRSLSSGLSRASGWCVLQTLVIQKLRCQKVRWEKFHLGTHSRHECPSEGWVSCGAGKGCASLDIAHDHSLGLNALSTTILISKNVFKNNWKTFSRRKQSWPDYISRKMTGSINYSHLGNFSQFAFRCKGFQ